MIKNAKRTNFFSVLLLGYHGKKSVKNEENDDKESVRISYMLFYFRFCTFHTGEN
jgi:hypothetical protein